MADDSDDGGAPWKADTTELVVEAASHGGLFGILAAGVAALVAWAVVRSVRR